LRADRFFYCAPVQQARECIVPGLVPKLRHQPADHQRHQRGVKCERKDHVNDSRTHVQADVRGRLVGDRCG
jgi:hypothetical protein